MIRLVVADDEAVIRNGIVRTLEQQGDFEIFVAENGEQAVEQTLLHQADAMVLDVCMPKMDGIQVMQRLFGEPDCPVVFVLSGHSEFTYVRQMLKYEVVDYILKPVDRADVALLGARIVERVKRRRQEREQSGYEQYRAQMLSALVLPALGPPSKTKSLCRRIEQLSGQLVCVAARDTDGACAMLREGFAEIRAMDLSAQIFHHRHFALLIIGELIGTLKDLQTTSYLEHIAKLIYSFHSERGLYDWLCAELAQFAGLGQMTGRHAYFLRAKDYIDCHYTQDLSVQSIAEQLGITSNYLGRIFRESGEGSVLDYVKERRVQHAAYLLGKHKLRVAEAALQSGIPDQRYFSQIFREYYGMSPRDYKKIHG